MLDHTSLLLLQKPQNISNLHDAAKWGDVDAAHKMLNEGADVNQKVSLALCFGLSFKIVNYVWSRMAAAARVKIYAVFFLAQYGKVGMKAGQAPEGLRANLETCCPAQTILRVGNC